MHLMEDEVLLMLNVHPQAVLSACCHSSQCIFSDMCDVTMIGSCVLLSAAISRAPYGECRLGEKTGAGCDGGTEMVQCVTGGHGVWLTETEQ